MASLKTGRIDSQNNPLQVNMERSWHLLFEETAKAWLPSLSVQLTVECSMSWLRAAYLRLVNPRPIKFSLPWRHSHDKLSHASFSYCKWRKAGQGPRNEATRCKHPFLLDHIRMYKTVMHAHHNKNCHNTSFSVCTCSEACITAVIRDALIYSLQESAP